MIRLLSYIYPITKRVASRYSGVLEITWHNGKKYLNTKNANYSYGSLQTILKTGLQKINLSRCNKLLLLGLGAGSVVETLTKDFKYNNPITAVEIDPVILEVARHDFNLEDYENLKIICDDAISFVQTNKEKFDLIIIDLFIDTIVPSSLYRKSFWEQLIKANSSTGNILFNASLNSDNNDYISEITMFLKSKNYKLELLQKVNGTNTLLIAKLT